MVQIDDVADTAFLTAYARACETERADALFDDPLAAALLTTRGRELGERTLGPAMGWSIVVRTVLIDELLASAIANGVGLVVNLGAGLDTRPYRMALPPTLTWIEVDQPHIIAHKNARLAERVPRCKLERLAADLTDVTQRRDIFDHASERNAGPVLVLTEGVIPYWQVETVARFADDLRSIANVSSWVVDHIPPHVIEARRRAGINSDSAPLLFDPPDWCGFFASHGWRPALLRNLFDEGQRVGRPMPLPPGVPVIAGDATTRSRAFPGYALLEPS